MADETDEALRDPAAIETIFSRDDWRPGEISRHPDAPPPLAPGDVLFGAYEIEGILGEGGMGAVYRAHHISLDGPRAIKVMSPNLTTDPDAVERFHREAQALLDVHHPAVVRCHDLLRDGHGRIFLVMELIEGTPLSERMAQRPLSADELRAVAKRIGGGLTAAHARGVVHRDVAPDNIVLPEGRAELAKLVDFGIAKVLRVGEQTMTTGFKGKLAFASPEQLGFRDGEVGAASDFFSLGLVLCGAALGKRIDMGKSLATAVEARRRPIELPAALPRELHGDVARLLELDPARRPTSMDGLFEPPTAAAGRRSPMAIALAAGLLLGLAVGAWWLQNREPIAPGFDPRTADVAAPEPAIAEPLPEPSARPVEALEPDGVKRFGVMREQLITARRQSSGIDVEFFVTPNPVQDGGAYQVEILSNCDCQALVFFVDANEDRIELLYPNPLESVAPLRSGETFVIPSSDQLYTLEAVSGTGIDRIKLFLLPEGVNFPRDGLDTELDLGDIGELSRMLEQGELQFWSVTPGEHERLGELGALLDELGSVEWVSAETVLHVLR